MHATRWIAALSTVLAVPVASQPQPAPRVEVRGVEVTGAWLGLTRSSFIAAFFRDENQRLHLIYPDSSRAWTALDSGTASIGFEPLPAAQLQPTNCLVTAGEFVRWDPATQSRGVLKPVDCGPIPETTTGPNRPIPGHPSQGPVDPFPGIHGNAAADHSRYLIVLALDAPPAPEDSAAWHDNRLLRVPVLEAAWRLGSRLAGPGPGWAAVVVRIGR